MDIWKRLATYIVVAATKDGNQDKILAAHARGTGNCMVRVDLNTIKMTGWLWASKRRRQSQSAKHRIETKTKTKNLPVYDTSCAKGKGIDIHCQDSINSYVSSKSGQFSLSFARSLNETV